MNYYKVLQVDSSADPEVIAAAYKRLAVKHHPDTNASSVEAKARMQALNAAYAVLSDPVQRAAYDYRMASEQIRRPAQHVPQPDTPPAAPEAASPSPFTNMRNAKSIGVYLALVAVLLAVVRLGFPTIGWVELGVVLIVSLLLVQPISAWLSRRSQR